MVSSKGVKFSVSDLIVGTDRLSEKAIEVNRLLKDSLGGKVGIIDNINLNELHLNGSRLHLNMINCMKLLDLSESRL